MVYGMAWWARHDIWYGLADIAWYVVWPGEVCHGIWKGIVLHALRQSRSVEWPMLVGGKADVINRNIG